MARALRDVPEADRPYVFTKGGLVWDESDRSKAPQRVANPTSLRRDVEASLRRLGVDRIDLYQLHWPAEHGTPLEEYWQTFLDLRAEGKIRAARPVQPQHHSAPAERLGQACGPVGSGGRCWRGADPGCAVAGICRWFMCRIAGLVLGGGTPAAQTGRGTTVVLQWASSAMAAAFMRRRWR